MATNKQSILDTDPEDPSQLLDEAGQYTVVDLDTDARPQAEAEADLDSATASADPGEEERDSDADEPDDEGDLYGVHLPRAADREDEAAAKGEGNFEDEDLGENLFESLEKRMAEGGTVPEHEVDPVDESDRSVHHKSDQRDRPVADRGSGGKSGL